MASKRWRKLGIVRSMRAARKPTSHAEGLGTADSYGKGPPMRCTSPLPGGSGSQWAAVWVPHAAQSVMYRYPSGEKPRGQWKSMNQKRSSSSLTNGPLGSATHGDAVSAGVHPGYHSRNWSAGTTSAT